MWDFCEKIYFLGIIFHIKSKVQLYRVSQIKHIHENKFNIDYEFVFFFISGNKRFTLLLLPRLQSYKCKVHIRLLLFSFCDFFKQNYNINALTTHGVLTIPLCIRNAAAETSSKEIFCGFSLSHMGSNSIVWNTMAAYTLLFPYNILRTPEQSHSRPRGFQRWSDSNGRLIYTTREVHN